MNPFRRIADFFRRKPGMIGTPPSQRQMWHDPAAHARDFAERYAEPLDVIVSRGGGSAGGGDTPCNPRNGQKQAPSNG